MDKDLVRNGLANLQMHVLYPCLILKAFLLHVSVRYGSITLRKFQLNYNCNYINLNST